MNDNPEIRKMDFVFARLHFEGFFAEDANKKIKDVLIKAEKETIEEGKYKWAFGNIDSQQINGNEIVFGRLGRTITQKFETIYDQINHSYKKELIKSTEATYSNFFIMSQFNLLAYEEKHNLTKLKFINKFMEFWGKYDFSNISFEFVKDEVEIFEIVKSWDRLTKATFDLVPSNPSSRDVWVPTDKIIREAKAERAKLDFENKKGSLAKEESIIQQAISMASDGYGEFKLKGIKGDVVQNFDSITKIIRREIHSIDDLKTITGQIYQEILKIVKDKDYNEKN